jgi:hypothetical protein
MSNASENPVRPVFHARQTPKFNTLLRNQAKIMEIADGGARLND